MLCCTASLDSNLVTFQPTEDCQYPGGLLASRAACLRSFPVRGDRVQQQQQTTNREINVRLTKLNIGALSIFNN
jgi:hypothetical protein